MLSLSLCTCVRAQEHTPSKMPAWISSSACHCLGRMVIQGLPSTSMVSWRIRLPVSMVRLSVEVHRRVRGKSGSICVCTHFARAQAYSTPCSVSEESPPIFLERLYSLCPWRERQMVLGEVWRFMTKEAMRPGR